MPLEVNNSIDRRTQDARQPQRYLRSTSRSSVALWPFFGNFTWLLSIPSPDMSSAKSDAPARRLTVVGSILASATGACAAVLVTNMPETVKTRLQLDGEGAKKGTRPRQYNGIVDAVQKIYKLEGIRGLQAGLSAGLAYQFVMNGARLGLYEPIQKALRNVSGAGEHSWGLKITSAALSGAVGATLGSPIYLIKSRLQAQSAHFQAAETHSYSGLTDGLRQVYRAEGVKGLFRGVDGALPRVMAGSATQLSTYDAAKRLVTGSLGVSEGSMSQFFSASLLASVITVTVMNPLDVVSTRLYQSAGKATSYSGPLDCAVKTIRSEGLLAMQKGWLAQYARLGPHTILTFVMLEQLKPLFAAVPLFSVPLEPTAVR